MKIGHDFAHEKTARNHPDQNPARRIQSSRVSCACKTRQLRPRTSCACRRAQSAPKKTVCGGCGKICRSLYGKRWRRPRDLRCGDYEVYLDFELRRVAFKACGLKNERLAFLSSNTKFTLRCAMRIGGLCRAMTIQDVARLMHLDWETVKELDKIYMREQFRLAGHPKPRVIGVDENSIRKNIPIALSSAILLRAAPYGSAAQVGRKPTWAYFMGSRAGKTAGKSSLP